MIIYLIPDSVEERKRVLVNEIQFTMDGQILAYSEELGYLVIDPKEVLQICPARK